tara:strand:- start:253 stop:738 length:486 start_codon:yes stop_codon:yes gene_type:complete
MRKAIFVAVAVAFLAAMSFGTSMADDVVPGAYTQQDQSVMGVGQTMMQMGARDRSLTSAVNLASGAGRSRSSVTSTNTDFQFGQSQTDQSWKAAQTVEEAEVYGLVAGDCQGDNSTDAYRRQMNQSRDGYVKETLVSNADCEADHATLKSGTGDSVPGEYK